MRTIRAAFRLLLFVSSTIGLHSFWFVTHVFIPNKVRWRQVIFEAWTKSFVRISNMHIEVIGTPPKPPFFLVTNHLSYTDIGALRAIVKGVFVAKSDIQSWFLAGRICRDMGTIFIDRGNRRDIPRAGELIIQRLDAGEGVVVFPEGTSTKGETVLPFIRHFSSSPPAAILLSHTPLSRTPRRPANSPPTSPPAGGKTSVFSHTSGAFLR